MLEGAVMEYAKWFIGVVSVMLISVAVIFMFRLNEVNSFQQDVNYQIERHGGLTEEAKIVLNEKAKKLYGGCIVESLEDNAPCLFAADRADDSVKSSGFFIREYRTEGGQDVYYDRGDEQARYGTTIQYVLTRQIGNINGKSLFKPSVIGMSASRVRGDASE
jgi:preprotein translocase subunit SecF